MSDEPPPNSAILDYASPRRRAPLAMNAKSVIRVTALPDGIDIVETLVEQGQALAAIIFTSFAIGLMGFTIFMSLHRPAQFRDFIPVIAVYGSVVASVAWLIVAVIHSNWKMTILEVRHDQLSLIFSSPIRKRYYDWHSSQIRQVKVINELRGKYRVHEIQIEIGTDPLVCLFTGHPQTELANIASRIVAITTGAKMVTPLGAPFTQNSN